MPSPEFPSSGESTPDFDINRTFADGLGANIELQRQLRTQQEQTEFWKHRATHHPISELPNALGFKIGVEEMRIKHPETPIGILAVDLANFKSLNDTYGHAKGDDTLKKVGDQLRVDDIEALAGHEHGDEYVVASLLTARRQLELSDQQRLEAVVGRVRKIGEILCEQDPELVIVNFGLSVGGVVMQPGIELADALAAADAAMYADKARNNRGR